jgi:hypothetical protein
MGISKNGRKWHLEAFLCYFTCLNLIFVEILGNFQLSHHYYCLTVTGHVLATTSSLVEETERGRLSMPCLTVTCTLTVIGKGRGQWPSSQHSMNHFSVVFVKTKIFYGPFNFCMGHLYRITKLSETGLLWTTVTLGSLTCKECGNLSTQDLCFIYVSSEGRVGCEFIHSEEALGPISIPRGSRGVNPCHIYESFSCN